MMPLVLAASYFALVCLDEQPKLQVLTVRSNRQPSGCSGCRTLRTARWPTDCTASSAGFRAGCSRATGGAGSDAPVRLDPSLTRTAALRQNTVIFRRNNPYPTPGEGLDAKKYGVPKTAQTLANTGFPSFLENQGRPARHFFCLEPRERGLKTRYSCTVASRNRNRSPAAKNHRNAKRFLG